MNKVNNNLSRRKFLGITTAAAGLAMVSWENGISAASGFQSSGKPNSRFGGVQVGAITYSWRSMPGTPEDIVRYCQQTGISSIELMGDVAEKYAGIPGGKEGSKERLEWRLAAPLNKYKELRKMFNDAGVKIHIAKFSPANWTEAEIDYSFKAAKALGAIGVCNEIGDDACEKMGPIAKSNGMVAIFHNHLQPGEPGWSFEKFLDYSPANMLNFDAGHYYGATGLHPNGIIEKLHKRIVSIHVKDKTGPKDTPANTNMTWGEGKTPISDILLLIKKNKWPIYVDIELEYPVPEGSDAVAEVRKCVEYCRKILA
ncbi:MAG TPA: sugar phosphate isomerase/epimerase [Bacteroidales bacterium]|nr:sugar phosphate isomerase/epimerase [Bacteroidales bacterium]